MKYFYILISLFLYSNLGFSDELTGSRLPRINHTSARSHQRSRQVSSSRHGNSFERLADLNRFGKGNPTNKKKINQQASLPNLWKNTTPEEEEDTFVSQVLSIVQLSEYIPINKSKSKLPTEAQLTINTFLSQREDLISEERALSTRKQKLDFELEQIYRRKSEARDLIGYRPEGVCSSHMERGQRRFKEAGLQHLRFQEKEKKLQLEKKDLFNRAEILASRIRQEERHNKSLVERKEKFEKIKKNFYCTLLSECTLYALEYKPSREDHRLQREEQIRLRKNNSGRELTKIDISIKHKKIKQFVTSLLTHLQVDPTCYITMDIWLKRFFEEINKESEKELEPSGHRENIEILQNNIEELKDLLSSEAGKKIDQKRREKLRRVVKERSLELKNLENKSYRRAEFASFLRLTNENMFRLIFSLCYSACQSHNSEALDLLQFAKQLSGYYYRHNSCPMFFPSLENFRVLNEETGKHAERRKQEALHQLVKEINQYNREVASFIDLRIEQTLLHNASEGDISDALSTGGLPTPRMSRKALKKEATIGVSIGRLSSRKKIRHDASQGTYYIEDPEQAEGNQ